MSVLSPIFLFVAYDKNSIALNDAHMQVIIDNEWVFDVCIICPW